MMGRPIIALGLSALVLTGATSAQAFELTRLPTHRCIATLSGDGSLTGGIATGSAQREAYVEHCDGTRQRILLQEDGLVLEPASSPAPLPPKTDALPDGEVTAVPGRIAAAWLTGPTTLYRHGILGDQTEASGFRVVPEGGKALALSLPDDSVFEDLRLRLVDLTGDGAEEFLVVRAYLDRGAALSVFGRGEGGLALLGETRPIGSPHRWLNPIGVADFDNDGKAEVALVVTPHIGGLLQLHELTETGLRLEQEEFGFSNHAIGSRVLDMAAVIDWNRDGTPDLALPDTGRHSLQVVTFTGGRFALLDSLPQEAALTTAILTSDLNGDGRAELVFGLDDGSVVLLRP